MAEWRAHGGTLILGGGFAGSAVARLLGQRGATIVSPENFRVSLFFRRDIAELGGLGRPRGPGE